MTIFTIDELTIPESLEAPGGGDFIEMTRVRNQIEADTLGSWELAYEPAELLPSWQDPFNPMRLFVARMAGRIVGRGIYQAPIEEGSREAWIAIEVLAEARRRGIGAAFYDLMVGLARTDGRPTIQTFPLQPPSAGEQLTSPTGFGSVPVDSPTTRFLVARGFTLEQVERMSRLPLPFDEQRMMTLEAAAAEHARDYRIVRWVGRTPDEWLDDIALLRQRMSTDAPTAGLEWVEEQWDADRVRELDDRLAQSPRRVVTAAALHEPSGTLVGFSELSVPPELERPVEQADTLVLREHRGHRLGLLIKLANVAQLEETFPGHPAITTFNAEENRHMLNVNEAIGFVPVAYAGGWKLTGAAVSTPE